MGCSNLRPKTQTSPISLSFKRKTPLKEAQTNFGYYGTQKTNFQMSPFKMSPFTGNEKCAQTFFAQTFRTPPGLRDIPAKNSRDIPDSLPRNPRKTNFRGRARNFLTTTPSRGRPPPHPAVSGPKKLSLCSFFWPDFTLRIFSGYF